MARTKKSRHGTKTKTTNADLFREITERIVSLLEEGTVPWHKPWKAGKFLWPRNLHRWLKKGANLTLAGYRGINVFLLAVESMTRGYVSPFWVTFKQAKDLGGNVRKGEKGTRIIFWNWVVKQAEDEEGKPRFDEKGSPLMRRFPILKAWTVFNSEQCEGLAHLIPQDVMGQTGERDFNPIKECEALLREACPRIPRINHGGARAYYDPREDRIQMPGKESFEGDEEYYSTLFHEITHSTGHPSRLDRDTLKDAKGFGDTNYSKEELVAELGASFLCGMTGILNSTVDNSAAYIKGWVKALKGDHKLVVYAAQNAQKAVDYVTGISHEAEAEIEREKAA